MRSNRVPKPTTIKYITREQYQILFDGCICRCHQLILAFMFEGGFTVGNILNFRLDEINITNNQICFIPRENIKNDDREKRGTGYVAFLPSHVMKLYSSYLLDERVGYDTEYVFVNPQGPQEGKPMKYRAVQKLLTRLSSETGIWVTTRMFRRGFTVECMQSGIDIQALAQMLQLPNEDEL